MSRLAVTVLAVLLLLLLVRALLPVGIEWYANRKLDASTAYGGSIGDVDLHLYRGAYRVENVTIEKITGAVPVPLFDAERVDFSILWSALLDGALVSDIEFHEAEVHIVDSEDDEKDQLGKEENWLAVLNGFVPFRIDRVTVENGALHFHNFDPGRNIDVFIYAIAARAENLTNSSDLSKTVVGTISGTGKAVGSGSVEFDGAFDPGTRYPTFNLNGRVSDVPVMALDSLIKAYAPFDVEAGQLTVTTELAAKDGAVTGYVKPLVTELEVFDWRDDVVRDDDNPLQVVWEGLVAAAAEVLENQEKDQLATRIPVEGRLDKPDTSPWSALVNILRNAFIDAFTPAYENSVSTEEAGDSA